MTFEQEVVERLARIEALLKDFLRKQPKQRTRQQQ